MSATVAATKFLFIAISCTTPAGSFAEQEFCGKVMSQAGPFDDYQACAEYRDFTQPVSNFLGGCFPTSRHHSERSDAVGKQFRLKSPTKK